jgi:UDP-N-acetylmuramoyl-tripeptide--D-alanyl-D-alanine ligase
MLRVMPGVKMRGLVRTLRAWRRRLRGLRARRARDTRAGGHALFIGVTGSSGKSTTAALLAHLLEGKGRVVRGFGRNVYGALVGTIERTSRHDDFAVAEVAVGRAGDMKRMAELLRPDVAVVTLAALEHYSAFRSHAAVAAEKGGLVEALAPGGFALLNADDPHVMSMAARTRGRIVTFGRSRPADYRATRIAAAFPGRLCLTVEWRGGEATLRTNLVGEHFWLPVLAALAAAIELGVEPELAAERVSTFEPLANRCSVVDVPGGPTLVVDTVKAPWHSLWLAFDLIAGASAPRRRIVLGQISDCTGSHRRYRSAYRYARSRADQVVFVGEHSHRSGASQQDRDEGRFAAFQTPAQVAEHLRKTAIPGELILLKGSPNLHLERIALSWTHDVRCWIPTCGKRATCQACGLWGTRFEDHPRRRWARGRRARHLRGPAPADPPGPGAAR